MKFHFFPEGRLCSLRGALLLWLVPAFLLVGGASAAVSYWTYKEMVGEFMDDQMKQLAHAVAGSEGLLSPPVYDAERIHKWGSYATQVYDANGRLVVNTWNGLPAGLEPHSGFIDVQREGKPWRAYVVRPEGGKGRAVQVMQSGVFRKHLAAERAGAALAPVLILLPLSILILWGVARSMSRALQDIAREASSQDAHSVAELPMERVPQEIQPLVMSFNSLLGRVREALATQRRFVQDAAHELRTPITAVGLQLENVRRDLPPGACSESFGQLQGGVSRAQRLVDQLLKLSRQQATATLEAPSQVDLQAQLHESINTLIALADQRNIDLGLVGPEAPLAPITVRCAQGDLRSLLDNLIENALRYTPEGGVVDVRVAGDAQRPVVEVVDTGPGIPAEMLPRVFDRFFRVPGTEGRGSGLGLAIAQSAAQRCGLRIALRNREDRSGLIARIEMAA